MKKIRVSGFLAMILLTQPANAAPLCEPGQGIDVLWQGYWLPAIVLDVDEEFCYINYEGYGEEYNEWVGADRIRFVDKSLEVPAGTRVEVLWQDEWYPATVLKSRGARYFVTYDGWSSQWDEWVGPERVRPAR